MPKITSSLFINALELPVHLGWTDKERQKKQIVWLDIAISFFQAPKACSTDQLDDTLCYSDLIDVIRKKISKKKFRLVEHLATDIHHLVKILLPKKTKLHVSITKYPEINGLNGGVSFHYGDHP